MNVQLANFLAYQQYRNTKPRQVVFELILREHPIPFSDVIAAYKQLGVDKASVYRSVSVLLKTGAIFSFDMRGKQVLEVGDMFSTHHHHLTCDVCRAIITVDSDILERELERVAVSNGFILTHHSIQLSGKCLQCQKPTP